MIVHRPRRSGGYLCLDSLFLLDTFSHSVRARTAIPTNIFNAPSLNLPPRLLPCGDARTAYPGELPVLTDISDDGHTYDPTLRRSCLLVLRPTFTSAVLLALAHSRSFILPSFDLIRAHLCP